MNLRLRLIHIKTSLLSCFSILLHFGQRCPYGLIRVSFGTEMIIHELLPRWLSPQEKRWSAASAVYMTL